METKEAVKWIFDIWHEWENVYGISGEISLEEGKKMDEVIELLKRGEKFEKMWEELEKEKCLMIDFDNEGYFKSYHCLGDIKGKYFPKPSDNFTEKVMKKINKEGEVRSNVDSKTNI